MKIQTRVLKDIYFEGKKVSIEKISNNTGLTINQIYEAIRHLKDRGLIKVEGTRTEDIGYKKPPYKKVLIEINDNVINRIKKVIRRGENE